MSGVDREAAAIRAAVLSERLFNARRTHLVRLVGLGFFAALFLGLGVLGGDPAWSTNYWALGAYLLLAAGCVGLAARSDAVGEVLILAPALLDMPFIYLVQRGQYATTPSPAAVAGFSLGIFALLLAIAALSSSRGQLVLSAVSAAVFEVLLQREAGVSVGAQLSAVAIIGLTAFVLNYASQRRTRLLVQTSRREKLAALGQLSAGIGHEIRNPLAAIGNAVFVLRRRLAKAEALSEKVEEPLQLAEREIAACQRIVSDLLDYTRDSALELQPVAVGALLEECVGLLRARPEVAVRVEAPAGLPQVPGQRDRLRQVFVNLLQNGVEAVPPGRPGQVTATARASDEELCVEIRDDGAGMDAATRARVFEPLFTTKKTGTGLGLAIVESLVKQHGGRLELETAPGRGTAFTVRLPRLLKA